MNTEQILIALHSDRLPEIENRYISKTNQARSGTQCEQLIELFAAAEKGEMQVPILGLQGSGKSTLLNALLMDDIILPVNAQETNCIPVEIRHADGSGRKMIVHFLDNQKSSIEISTPEELEQFVSDEFNHANEKEVSHAEIFINSELLNDHLVFVDLPGVGSLTEHNVKVTMDYLQKKAGAVFLMNTTPPITRTEKNFIKAAIQGMGVFWFVQNRWADESDEEVNASVEHNKRILRSIFDDPAYQPTIFVVDAKQSMEAKFAKDPDSLTNQGLMKLLMSLISFRTNWRKLVLESAAKSFQLFITGLGRIIRERIADQDLDIKQIELEIAEKEKAYKNMIERNENKIRLIKEDLNKFQVGAGEQCNLEANTASNNVRIEMRKTIQGGVVDGPYLNKAFENNNHQYSKEAALNISDFIEVFNSKLTLQIEELEIIFNETGTINVGKFTKNSEFKYEKSFPLVGAAVGSVAGFFIEGMVAGAIGGSWGGPVGMAAGIVVGLGFALAGAFAYNKRMENRMIDTMQQLEPALQEVYHSLEVFLIRQVNNYCSAVIDSLDKFVQEQKNSMSQEFQEANQRLKARLETTMDDLSRYNKDIEYISELEGAI